jgi:zinc D-Ala-D-Ala carboxypeptidase
VIAPEGNHMTAHRLTEGSRFAAAAVGAAVLGAATTIVAIAATAQDLATQILNTSNITLATVHVSGVVDGADAHSEIVDTSHGGQAKRSHYGTAPGGTVALDPRVLQGMLNRARSVSFRVSEIAGGSHMTPQSRHYLGLAFDVDLINGHGTRGGGPDVSAFMQGCRNDGATQVLFEGNHVHCGW